MIIHVQIDPPLFFFFLFFRKKVLTTIRNKFICDEHGLLTSMQLPDDLEFELL